MKWARWFLLVLTVLLGLAGSYFLFLVLFDPGEAFPDVQGLRAGVWVTLGLWAGTGLGLTLLRRMRWAGAQSGGVNPRLERKVLSYARRNGGRLTVAEVALNTRCSVQKAEEVLRALVRQNVAQVLYTASMDAVYVINGFDEQAQAQAQDILDSSGS